LPTLASGASCAGDAFISVNHDIAVEKRDCIGPAAVTGQSAGIRTAAFAVNYHHIFHYFLPALIKARFGRKSKE
jgi:hypothetical protein